MAEMSQNRQVATPSICYELPSKKTKKTPREFTNHESSLLTPLILPFSRTPSYRTHKFRLSVVVTYRQFAKRHRADGGHLGNAKLSSATSTEVSLTQRALALQTRKHSLGREHRFQTLTVRASMNHIRHWGDTKTRKHSSKLAS